MNFNEIFWENVTYDDIKKWLKTKLYTLFRQYLFWNIFLGLILDSQGYRGFFFFLNETLILVFAE